MRKPLKWLGKLRHRGTYPKEDPRQTSEEGTQKTLRKRGNCMEGSKSYDLRQ
jgi:hypothetical protein